MILTIDIGNTNVVCTLFEGEKPQESLRLASDLNFFAEFSILKKYDIDGIVISSVVPGLTSAYIETCRNLFRLDPVQVDYRNSGLKTDVIRPDEIGADRICNVVAAVELYGTPGIVVDFGTATTYDVIDPKGVFIGGAIAPGIDVSARYLFESAALLRETAFTIPDTPIGRDTATNLQAGIMFGAIDEVEGMVKRILQETGWRNPPVLLTGGFSPLISKGLRIPHFLVPDLTSIGMRIIFEKTVKNDR
ncbi:MAG: type III pantothenate kinase [FCB group bacterium]|nr:type III pantothenate kinase [FCB group bacterium]